MQRAVNVGGNLIIDSEKDAGELGSTIAKAIQELCLLDIAVIVKDKDQLFSALSGNTIKDEAYEKSKTILCFAAGRIRKEDAEGIGEGKGIVECYTCAEDMRYICRNGIGRSKLTTAFIEKTLRLRTMGRNVRTIEALLQQT